MLCVAWLNISCIVSIEYNSKSTFTCACNNTSIVACVSNLMMAACMGSCYLTTTMTMKLRLSQPVG